MKNIVLPTHDNLFIKRIDPVKEVNGIVVPEASQDRPNEGIIVALGPNVMTAARRAREIEKYVQDRSAAFGENVKPEDSWTYYDQTFDLGDHVIFGRFSGIDVTIDDQVFVKVKPDEIHCVVKSEPEPESEPQPPADVQEAK